jgi:hypothetical protein
LFSAFILTGTVKAQTPPITVFSAGMVTPESITPAPSDFGAYGDQYFIPDAGRPGVGDPKIWTVPASGGSPSLFVNNPSGTASSGGLFLPSSGWGTLSGKFLAVGEGDVLAFDAQGGFARLSFAQNQEFFSPMLAPSGFVAHSGQVLLGGTYDGADLVNLFTLSPTADPAHPATLTSFASLPIGPFGLAFAPSGFGTVGSTLLVSDAGTGTIVSVNDQGVVAPFAQINLGGSQFGLRQMAFAPPNFLPGHSEPLLFVSRSGSVAGGGSLGDILVLDGAGHAIESLRTDLGLVKFDPRGLFFSPAGLLVSDASDSIRLVQPTAFQAAIPEPQSLVLLLIGLVLLVGALGTAKACSSLHLRPENRISRTGMLRTLREPAGGR